MHQAAGERLHDDAILGVVDLAGDTVDATALRHHVGGFTVLNWPEGVEHPGDMLSNMVEVVVAGLLRMLAGAQLGVPDLEDRVQQRLDGRGERAAPRRAWGSPQPLVSR